MNTEKNSSTTRMAGEGSPDTDPRIAAAAAELEQLARDNGGPYEAPPAYRGSCARTTFDRPGTDDGSVTVLVPEHQMGGVMRGAFLRIPSVHPRTGVIEAE